jgi:twitching motility protein PilT
MIEFFPAVKQEQIRSILAGVLRGVVSQRLLPRVQGGRVAAVEVMVTNSRIADLIRDQKVEEVPDAIGEGEFFDMQTFTDALIELVLQNEIDRDVAANAATNRHDFLVALEHALKRQAAGIEHDGPMPEMAPEPEAEAKAEEQQVPGLRLAGSQEA